MNSHNQATDILQEVLASSAEQTVEHISGAVLGSLLATSVANPVAAVLATLAKVLVKKIFQETSSVDKKLDVLLSEPLQTAVTTLEDILSVQVTTPDEQSECNRRLTEAANALMRAYSYALTSRDPRWCELIRLYQIFISALLPGGRPFVALYIKQLRSEAASKRCEASARLAEADITVLEQQENLREFEEFRDYPYLPPSQPGSGIFQIPPALVPSIMLKRLKQKENELRASADDFIHKSAQLDNFCEFVEAIVIRRTDILGAMKE